MESDIAILNPGDRALIQWNGYVYFSSHVVMISSCPVDVTLFPFDIQECNITIGSTIHNAGRMILNTTLKNGSSRGNGVLNTTLDITRVNYLKSDLLHYMYILNLHYGVLT